MDLVIGNFPLSIIQLIINLIKLDIYNENNIQTIGMFFVSAPHHFL